MSDGLYDYPGEVVFELDQDEPESFERAAEFINLNGYDVLSVQHEYGIYGERAGTNLLALMRRVKMPIVTTLHTVLRSPTDEQRRVLDEVLLLSARVVVMSVSAIELLSAVHEIDLSKIDFIPHGVPVVSENTGAALRKEMGGSGPILLTFGLLSPDKGIQAVIRAMPGILKEFPDAQYHIVGATHPHELTRNGESYRQWLHELALSVGVESSVKFVNEFVSLERLTQYLSAIDYYLTPYLNPEQITSGTLAYSMAAGKVIISTPYNYAQELLADGRGLLVAFGDADSIQAAVSASWRDPVRSIEMKTRALAFSRGMGWPIVAQNYLRSFEKARSSSEGDSRSVEQVPLLVDEPICLDHILRLTDDTGMIQHATVSVPNRAEGYCVDDNARALLLTVYLDLIGHPSPMVPKLQTTYLSFVAHALNPACSRFRNFMSYDRRWLEFCGSEDSQGRTLWALGFTAANSRDEAHVRLSESIFLSTLPAAFTLRSPRACAYAILGASSYLESHRDSQVALRLIQHLGSYLNELFTEGSSNSWPWMESRLSYANARIPQAMMMAGANLGNDQLLSRGIGSLTWLMEHQVTEFGCFSPVGVDGADRISLGSIQFDQQPVEAWSSLSACITASRFVDSDQFLEWAKICFAWFLGGNVLQKPMGSAKSGACFDGLQRHGVNLNQGAESTLSYLCASIELNRALASRS